MSQSVREVLSKTWAVVLEQTAHFIPKLIAGVFILAIGLLLARLIRGLTVRILLAIRLDRISDRMGISAFLARGDVRHTVVEILATIVYWLVLIVSLQILGLALGLEGMTSFLGQILGYLPRLIVALVIIMAGIAIGSFFGGAVQLAGSNAGLPGAKAVGAVVKYLVSFFALVMALEQLQIATQLLVATLQIIIGAVALALALSFGLGCRDLARQAVEDWLRKSQHADEARKPKDTTP
jgi:hypothetical protein